MTPSDEITDIPEDKFVSIRLHHTTEEAVRRWGRDHIPGYDPAEPLDAILFRMGVVDDLFRQATDDQGRSVDLAAHRACGWPG